MPKLSWEDMEKRDKQLISTLEHLSIRDAADKFDMDAVAVRAWLYRIRERRAKFQRYLNWQNGIMSRNSRVRKLLLSAKVEEMLEEEF